MAEDFTGVKPINEPIKPDQQKLEPGPPKLDPSDISAMDDMARKLMDEKEKKAAEEAEAAKKAQEEAEAAAAAEAAKTDEEREAERKAAEEAAAAEAAKTEEEREAERKAAEEAAAAEAAKTEEEKEAERKAAEEAAAKERQDDPYKDVQLPPEAKGKSAEAFATLKQRFAEDLEKRDAEIAQLRERVQQTEGSDPVPEEVKKELEDLRLFRARLDIQADPEFTKKYEGKIDQANEFIYQQLKTTGIIGDDHIKKFRELGGFHQTNFEDILEKIDNPTVTRLVQNKLDEIAVTKFEQQRALDLNKEDIQKYVKERQENYQKTLTQHHDLTSKELEKIYTTKMKWLQDPQLPQNADANAKALHEDTIKFNSNVKENMAIAARDDSPEMRAVLIAGMGQLLWLKRQFEFEKKARESFEKRAKDAEAQLAKIKKASIARPDRSSAPPSGGAPKPKIDYNTSAAEALDAHRKEQLNRV